MEVVLTQEEGHKVLLNKAWKQWGETAQLDMVVEEAAEVIQAINKWKRFRDDTAFDNLHMEVADLKICLDQLLLNLLSPDLVDAWYAAKMKKLESRLS